MDTVDPPAPAAPSSASASSLAVSSASIVTGEDAGANILGELRRSDLAMSAISPSHRRGQLSLSIPVAAPGGDRDRLFPQMAEPPRRSLGLADQDAALCQALQPFLPARVSELHLRLDRDKFELPWIGRCCLPSDPAPVAGISPPMPTYPRRYDPGRDSVGRYEWFHTAGRFPFPSLLFPRGLAASSHPPNDTIHPLLIVAARHHSQTEKLCAQGNHGVEELSQHLSSYFGRMISIAHKHGGEFSCIVSCGLAFRLCGCPGLAADTPRPHPIICRRSVSPAQAMS